MSIQVKKLQAALKHGAYSATALLPSEDLAAFRELHLKIIFGMVDQRKLVSVFRRADRLLLPSRFDSFGMVVAEAMACGVPAIMSDYGGAKELVEEDHNGFIASRELRGLSRKDALVHFECHRSPQHVDCSPSRR